MALRRLRNLVLVATLLTTAVVADIREYNFTVGWVLRNPDGLQQRRVVGINGQWPVPTIFANVGDQVVVNVQNDLGDRACTLHFHGLYMNGTSHMDGPAQVTQCPIAANASFTYSLNITQPGTYWYHSHIDAQYPDGLRGPLIVHDPENPYADQFDEEMVLTLSDWYHEEMANLLPRFLSVTNPTGAEPVPDSALMNDTQGLKIPVQPNKTYFIRIINMAAFAPQYFWIEGHTFRIIEVDGVYHNPAEASIIYVAPAQRYSILLTTKNETDKNYPIVGAMDQDLFDKVPDTLNPNVTSYLSYNPSAAYPDPIILQDAYKPFDDTKLVPTDEQALFENPSISYTVDMKMDNLGNGVNYAFFNDITYVQPKVPTLYTVLSSGNLSTDPTVYGVNTHPLILGHNEVVEIVLNNHDTGKHPFHLHGHAFQTVTRSADDAGDWDIEALKNGSVIFPAAPMRRDTLVVQPNGYFVIRFRSDNPGVWLFHCHIEWHVASGLILSVIEAPLALQRQLNGLNGIPQDHIDVCKSQNISYQGNAAGNTINLLDTTGMNVSPKPLPAGFTARGIVALVFSCIAGFLGIGVIAWYGLGEISNIEQEKEQQKFGAFAKEAGVSNATGVSDAAFTAGQSKHVGGTTTATEVR